MGVIRKVSCSQCGYESGVMHVGSGMHSLDPKEVLVCIHCKILFAGTASVRRETSPLSWPVNSHCQCPRCDIECPPAQTREMSTGGKGIENSGEACLQCPKCGFLDTQSTIIGLWD
jgi:hypothetical protein